MVGLVVGMVGLVVGMVEIVVVVVEFVGEMVEIVVLMVEIVVVVVEFVGEMVEIVVLVVEVVVGVVGLVVGSVGGVLQQTVHSSSAFRKAGVPITAPRDTIADKITNSFIVIYGFVRSLFWFMCRVPM